MSGLWSRACAIAIVLMCGCAGRAYRVVPAPPAQAMLGVSVLGVWDSNFGEITIEADDSRGGLATGSLSGTWTYRNPATMRDVRGVFYGTLTGTLLRLRWSEEDDSGDGFLEFSPTGDSYVGRWWNFGRTKTGVWRGWLRARQGDV